MYMSECTRYDGNIQPFLYSLAYESLDNKGGRDQWRGYSRTFCRCARLLAGRGFGMLTE